MENLSHSFLSFKNEFEENPDITDSVGSSQDYRDKFQLGFQVECAQRSTLFAVATQSMSNGELLLLSSEELTFWDLHSQPVAGIPGRSMGRSPRPPVGLSEQK